MTTLLPSGSSVRSRGALDDDVDLARDRALVNRAQAGDRAAFDDLYLRYYRRLYRFCLRRLHDPHESEDVAQEAFARAWRALPTFGGDRRFYPWLSVIASHLCTDVLRRRNRSTPVAEFHQGNVASTEDGGEELMIAAVDCELVSRAFKRLSERHQRILSLREGSGWSYQRIADHEGVGITAIETLLWRARQALKREFASLAGSEGRGAALVGGLFSMSMLRRLLSAPAQAARRLAHAGPGALAVGSAAAATAVVVAATVGAPAATPAVPLTPVVASPAPTSGPAPRAATSDVLRAFDPWAVAASTPSTTPVAAAGAPSLPTLPLPGLGDVAGDPLGVVGTLNQATGTVGQIVNGATQNLLPGLGGLTNSTPLAAALDPLLNGSSAPSTTGGAAPLAGVGNTLNNAVQAPGNLLNTLGEVTGGK